MFSVVPFIAPLLFISAVKKMPLAFKTTQGKCSANNMPALLFFHVSSPCIHTQCVGGSPLFGSQASFQNSSPSSPLCWIEAVLCATVLLPTVLIHTLPQHPWLFGSTGI